MRTRLGDRPPINYVDKPCTGSQWPEHQARALVTAGLITWLKADSILDPACGDGSVVLAADQLRPIEQAWLSDLAQPNILKLVRDLDGTHPKWSISHTPIERAFEIVGPYEVLVLTEILEHLEDPDAILRTARRKARHLIASSPEMRPGQIDSNPEHLWMFDGEGYEQMLIEAGWATIHKTHLTFRTMYNFQIWVCE